MSFLILTRPGCNRTARAKVILKSHNHGFSVSIHDTPEKLERFHNAGHTTFPVIYHQGRLLGGLEQLEDYLGI